MKKNTKKLSTLKSLTDLKDLVSVSGGASAPPPTCSCAK